MKIVIGTARVLLVFVGVYLELLERHYYKNPDNIRQIFARRGFTRTATAISVKRKRLGLTIAGADVYSAAGLASVRVRGLPLD